MYCVYKKNLCNIKIKMNLHIYKIYDLKILMNEIRSIEKVHPNNYVFWGFGFFFWFSWHFLYSFNFKPLLLLPSVLPVVSSLKKMHCAWQTGYPFGPLTRTPTAPRKPDYWSWSSSWCFPLDQDEDHLECWPPILACCPEWWKSQNSWWHR